MPYPNNMSVYRKRKEITQATLGELVGVVQPRICNIENEKEPTPPETLMEKVRRAIGFPGPATELLNQYDGRYDQQQASA